MKLVLLGPPGAGKGTQAAKISEQFGVRTISTGDIFRSVAQSNDHLSLKVREIIASGGLVPDALVNDVILSHLTDSVLNDGFVLDGFPRTVSQADVLEHFLGDKGTCLDKVINIEVDQSILFGRIQTRISQSGGNTRQDDNEQVLVNRLELYNTQTKPLLDYYTERNLLVSVDGMMPIESVTEYIISELSHSHK
jgi:adenylate kinase